MSKASTSNSEDLALAGMLFGIVITFFACNMPSLVINVMESFGVAGFESLIPISNFLIVFGCSTNFVFYCVFGKKFRSHLTRTLGISKSIKGNSNENSGETNIRMTSTTRKEPAHNRLRWNSVSSTISNVSNSVDNQPTNYPSANNRDKPSTICEAEIEDKDINTNYAKYLCEGQVSRSQVTVDFILSD